VDPKFELRHTSLVRAAQSTCFIGVNPGIDDRGNEVLYSSGNAFFVGPQTLITAAHVVPDNKRRIVAQIPGTRERTPLVSTMFNNPPFEVLDCTCIATGRPDVDISILQVTGTWKTEKYLQLDKEPLDIDSRPPVDLVGYVGRYDECYIQHLNPRVLTGSEIRDFEALLPKTKLLISHGSLVNGGIMPTYAVTTAVGMSGCPVLCDGRVIGI